MQTTRFGTGHLPPAERFEFWLDLVFRSHTRSLIRTGAADDFRASTFVLDLGAVSVSRLANPAISGDRTARLIRRCDPEAVHLHLPRDGGGTVAQGGREARFSPGDLVLYDSSRPLRVQQFAPRGTAEWVLVEIPRRVLEPLVPSMRDLVAVPFSARRGVGAVLARYLGELLANAHAYTPADQSALSGVTIDLAAAACAHRVDRDALAQPSRRQALTASIRDFIEQRLGDPALTPAAIADAHHISLRHLHQLFQGGVTVAAHIRRRRLERCRRDLADPLLNDRPVTVIAARWGFTDPSHFRKLFRKAHGLPPADYRYASQREQ